jgi:hypothetical protein
MTDWNWDRITGIALIFAGLGVAIAAVEYTNDTLLVFACFIAGYGMGLAGKSTMAAPVQHAPAGTLRRDDGVRSLTGSDTERGRLGAVDLERVNLRPRGKQRPPTQ